MNPAETLVADPLIQHMIDQVRTQQAMSYAGGLSGEWPLLVGGTPYTFTTRYSGSDIAMQKVTQFAYEHFQSLGLNVSYQDYELSTLGLRRNVIAEQTGRTQPQRVFLLTAHLDDTADSQNRLSLAPGADDNASGSAAVLAAADILSQYSFGCTLRYALFTGEEQGLWGSSVYAGSLKANGEDVEGVLNLDMIAYDSNAIPRLDLHTRAGNAGDERIADRFAEVVNAYHIPLEPEIIPDSMPRSDHAYFWYNNFPAILAIEDRDDTTPYYHMIGDRYATLNSAYLTHFVQAAVGTLAHLGCIMEGWVDGHVVEQNGAAPIAGAILEAQPGASSANILAAHSDVQGNFELLLPPGEYTLQAFAPSYRPLAQSPATVTDGGLAQVNFSLESCVQDTIPAFSQQPAELLAGQLVTFTATVPISATINSYAWDFGDGSPPQAGSDLTTVQHIFPFTTAAVQVFPVRLMVSNTCTSLAQAAVRVQPRRIFLPLAPSNVR